MPSSKDPNTAIGETPEQRSDRIWHLVHFVTEVIENNDVPADARAAIEEVLRKQTSPRQAPAGGEPAKAAATAADGTPLAAAAPGRSVP